MKHRLPYRPERRRGYAGAEEGTKLTASIKPEVGFGILVGAFLLFNWRKR